MHLTTSARSVQCSGLEVTLERRPDVRARPARPAKPLRTGAALSPAAVLNLQRLAGNTAVRDLVKTQAPETATPSVDDRLEAEAEAAASSRFGGSPSAAEAVSDREPTSSGSGRPLDPRVRSAAERGFGWDFSEVRIHDDADSAELTSRAGARAMTTGNDIAVAAGTGNLESDANRDLLHHELAHVVQQSRGRYRPAPGALAEGLSAAGPAAQPAPVVTAVVAGAEIGVGKTMNITATAAGDAALTWTLVGAPAGITITPRGRRDAVVRSAAAPLGAVPAGGGTPRRKWPGPRSSTSGASGCSWSCAQPGTRSSPTRCPRSSTTRTAASPHTRSRA